MIAIGLLVGFLIIGPALGWLAGLFNPMGFMGVLPWKVARVGHVRRSVRVGSGHPTARLSRSSTQFSAANCLIPFM